MGRRANVSEPVLGFAPEAGSFSDLPLITWRLAFSSSPRGHDDRSRGQSRWSVSVRVRGPTTGLPARGEHR